MKLSDRVKKYRRPGHNVSQEKYSEMLRLAELDALVSAEYRQCPICSQLEKTNKRCHVCEGRGGYWLEGVE